MGIEWGGTRDAAKYPTRHRLIQPKMSIVSRLRNPNLEIMFFITTLLLTFLLSVSTPNALCHPTILPRLAVAWFLFYRVKNDL